MFYVVDGSYYIFRAFYALRHMRNSKGMPTNGLYAFTNMLLNVVRDHEPHYLAVAFDPPGPVFRNRIYPEYKANRDEPPEDLVPQFPFFREIVRALKIPILEVPDFEADDLIGTVTLLAEAAGLECMVLSGDKDLAQLVTERTTLYDSMRDKATGIAEVAERFQVTPDRVADVLGLAGDSSDNIPGVPGIGEKTAGKLVAEFGSLDEVLANVDKVSGKKRKENLATYADQARLSRELATIKRDVPVDFDLDQLRLSAPDYAAFDDLCHQLEFRRFPRFVREIFASPADEPEPEAVSLTVQTIDRVDALQALVDAARSSGRLALRLFTSERDPFDAVIVGIALATEPGAAAYVPSAHQDLTAGQLPLDKILATLSPALEDAELPKTVHDAEWTARVLDRLGVRLRGVTDDPLLAGYLVDPNRRSFALETLAREFLSRRPTPLSDVVGSGRSARRFHEVGVEVAAPFAAEEAEATLCLGAKLRERLEGRLEAVHDEIELPLSEVLARMESTGIRIDVERLGRMSDEFHERLGELTARIYEHAGREFTINSPQQLGVVLFEDLELPVKKKGKSAPSTDASVLEALSELHPIAAEVLAYREVSKLASTYVDALPLLVRPETGRVHTCFNQAVAATGRLSSSDPNLQNIPVRTPEGRRIREAFVPEEGWTLIGADYSQIELRVLAHMCEDPVLVDAFVRGHDIHRRTAAEVLEIDPDDVSSDQRAAAKAINFGLIYGMGVNRLSRETPMTRDEARDYIERYFARISGVKPFMDGLIESARKLGYAETLVGRRRPIPELVVSESRRAYALGERLAKNTPIQGTAADIIKIAMNRVQAALDAAQMKTRMLLTVHDELVFETPPDELAAATALVREQMESAFELRVPLAVDVSTGASWAVLK